MSFITAITLLTGYYAIIFVGFFGIYIIYLRLQNPRDIGEILVYVSLFITGIIFAQLFFPAYINRHTLDFAKTTIRRPFFDGLMSISAIRLLNKYYFTLPVVIVFSTVFLYLKLTKKKIIMEKHIVFIFAVSILYTVIITSLAPDQILRYVMPVFPFFIFLPFAFINSVDNRNFSVIMTLSLLICFLIPAINGHNVKFIYKGKPDDYLFTKHKGIPVFVLNKSPFKYADLVPYFNDEQSYFFIDNINDSAIEQYDICYLVVENEQGIKDVGLEMFEVESEFPIARFDLYLSEVESEFPLYYFTGKKLIRK